jgi:hypothetical protein
MKERLGAILADPENQKRWEARPVREKKKPSLQTDLNERTHDLGRKMGYWAYRADYFDGVRAEQHDYLGIFDWVWYPISEPGPIVHVQHTSTANMAARRTKMQNSPWLKRIKVSGCCKALLIGWHKVNGRWEAVLEWL